MKAPTDLELMMFADGELDEARAAEVARHLEEEGGEDARGKLTAMSMVGDFTRRGADRLATASHADLIADAVMDRLSAPSTAKSNVDNTAVEKAAVEKAAVEKAAVRAASSDVSKMGPAKVETKKLDRLERTSLGPSAESAPANDNQRFIYGLAGIAAAAAIALGFWGRSAPESRTAGREPVVQELPSALPLEVASSQAPSPSAKSAVAVDEDEPTVKVASVDFGANTGAIYYVPRDTPGTTTVVWLADR